MENRHGEIKLLEAAITTEDTTYQAGLIYHDLNAAGAIQITSSFSRVVQELTSKLE